MCVFHKLCLVCFCMYLLSQARAAGGKDNADNDGPLAMEVNRTRSRDGNVKNVIHIHKHYDALINGNFNNSLEEAMYFVRMIFSMFGDKDHFGVDNLETLIESLRGTIHQKRGHGEHHHGHSHEVDEHEHGHNREDKQAKEEDGAEHNINNAEHTHNDKHSHEPDHVHGEHHHEHNEVDEHAHGHNDEDNHEHGHKVDEHAHGHNDEDKHEHSHEVDEHEHGHNHEDKQARNEDGAEHNINNTEHSHDEHGHNEMKNLNMAKEESSGNNEKHENRYKRTTEPHLDVNHTECLNVHSILNIYHFDNQKYLTSEQFLHLSPAIIYQMKNPKCKSSRTDSQKEDKTSTSDRVAFSGVSPAVWGYSTLAVVIISLVGLLGVAVIPIMQKVFYNHLLQFLVALAVGALTGDALLHLLPHAIVGESLHHDHSHGSSHSNHKSHQSAVLKGLCGLAGLFFFFLMERVLTIFTKIKRKRKQNKRRTLSPRHRSECRDDGNHIAKKLSAYDESDYQSCEEMIMVVHPNKSLKGYADETHDKVFHTSHDSCHAKEAKHSHSNPQASEEEGMLSLPHSHSGHSHHAHCEMLTNSVASVAWMVILGDGIHNFSDGLAIGAAFANSITGGVSTAIAVFCHELPHEIGDFAVLLRAGMSVKQAVVYNILSSIMCFIGMLIGVAIGNIDEASQWIFAAVAGMFIYIATVDMLPEMTSVDTKQGEHPFCHLFLQCVGMIVGAGIMLVIAFFEEDLLVALDG